jgi:DNA primase
MKSQWIDFKELRAKLRFSEVLKSYNIPLKVKGDKATGLCPLPCHPPHEGKRRTPSFSANLTRGIFQCFGCGAKGNVLDFVLLLQGSDPNDTAALRKVALELQDRFLGKSQKADTNHGERLKPSAADVSDGETQQEPDGGLARPVIANAPLDFTLKALDTEHPYLKQRGFTADTISHFGLGYCSRGLMQGRIVIPLHDSQGRLIGYAGRLVEDTKISDESPKYRFPGERERNGVVYGFKKSLFLYNGHRITTPVKDLIVVEGFASVWWLWQHGYHNVLALMGSSCSREQAELVANLVTDDGHVWGFPDGDDSGDRCVESLFTQLAQYRFVRWVALKDGQQPTDCSVNELAFLFPADCFGDGDETNELSRLGDITSKRVHS